MRLRDFFRRRMTAAEIERRLLAPYQRRWRVDSENTQIIQKSWDQMCLDDAIADVATLKTMIANLQRRDELAMG